MAQIGTLGFLDCFNKDSAAGAGKLITRFGKLQKRAWDVSALSGLLMALISPSCTSSTILHCILQPLQEA